MESKITDFSNEELIDEYIGFYKHSPQSQANRRSSLKYFFGVDHYDYQDHVSKITTKILKNYFIWLKNLPVISIATKQNKWTILISFLNSLMEDYDDFLIKIPQKSVNWKGTLGNGKIIKEILTKEEITKILDHFKRYNFKHYIIFRLFLETGMRKGELIQIKCSNIDIEERYIRTHGKTEESVYYFSKELGKYLKQYLNSRLTLKINTDILFLSKFRKQFCNRSFNKLLKNACEKVGIEKNITCHTFRRTINTYRKKMGCPNEDRKILLNHKVSDVNIESYIILEREEYIKLFDE
ncbi:MAG: tyrosine-type recombinase/integrase, partial [Promethearchaeota archaeon]